MPAYSFKKHSADTETSPAARITASVGSACSAVFPELIRSIMNLPKIDLPIEEMENVHIKPFKYAVENNIEMVMAAHLHCTCFDKEVIPSSLSQNAIGYLRNNLGYRGVIITDDMVMKGVEQFGSLQACKMAINAGVDMFIFRNSDDKTLKLIEDLVKEVEKDEGLQKKVGESYERIMDLKRRYGLDERQNKKLLITHQNI